VLKNCLADKLQIKLNDKHLEALDLARVHAVDLCSRPPALASESCLLRLLPAEETLLETEKTADRESFLEDKEQITQIHISTFRAVVY